MPRPYFLPTAGATPREYSPIHGFVLDNDISLVSECGQLFGRSQQ